MMQTKRISDDLRLVFHFDPKNPDMYCFVLEDTIYGNEIMITSEEMVDLIDSAEEMKKEMLDLTDSVDSVMKMKKDTTL